MHSFYHHKTIHLRQKLVSVAKTALSFKTRLLSDSVAKISLQDQNPTPTDTLPHSLLLIYTEESGYNDTHWGIFSASSHQDPCCFETGKPGRGFLPPPSEYKAPKSADCTIPLPRNPPILSDKVNSLLFLLHVFPDLSLSNFLQSDRESKII